MFDPGTSTYRKIHIVIPWAITVILAVLLFTYTGWLGSQATVGELALVEELQSGLTFKARVDTGAALSSIHCLQVEIPDEAEEPRENLREVARVKVANAAGETAWIETPIVDYAAVRTSDRTTHRYHVRLRLRSMGVEKRTLVTLKDRSPMRYKLLLGRDYLKDDFVVDVSR